MSKTPRSLSGKVAVVTGGARGIGAGVAKRLRADGHQVACLAGELERVQDHLGRTLSVNLTPTVERSAAAPKDGPLELAREPTRGTKRSVSHSAHDDRLFEVLRGMNAAEDARRRRADNPRHMYQRHMHRTGFTGAAESFVYGDDWGWT